MYDGADGILKLILQFIIWCLQNGSREGRTPLPTIIIGWSQNIRDRSQLTSTTGGGGGGGEGGHQKVDLLFKKAIFPIKNG